MGNSLVQLRRAACVLWLLAVAMPARAQPATAVEYYHAGFGHYFITAGASEIAALDGGGVAGWARTGETFAVDGSESVCRFFTARFAGKASHFYTPYASECSNLRAGDVWTYEGTVFRLDIPDAGGACRAGTRPLYRLYNQGRGGAANHRYTVRSEVAAQMRGQGWQQEGTGVDPVFACVPAAGAADLRGTIRVAAGVRQLAPEWTARVEAQSATEVVFTQSPGLAAGEVFVVPGRGAWRVMALADGGRRVSVSSAGVNDLFDELEIEGAIALTREAVVVVAGDRGVGTKSSLVGPAPSYTYHELDGQPGLRAEFKLGVDCLGSTFEVLDVKLGMYGAPRVKASKSRNEFEISGVRVVAESSARLGCRLAVGMPDEAILATVRIPTKLPFVWLTLSLGEKLAWSTDIVPAVPLAYAKVDGSIDIHRTPAFAGTYQGSAADVDSILQTIGANLEAGLNGELKGYVSGKLDLNVLSLPLAGVSVRTGPDLKVRVAFPDSAPARVCGELKWTTTVDEWHIRGVGNPPGKAEQNLLRHEYPIETGWLATCDATGWLFTLEQCDNRACGTCPPPGSRMIVPITELDGGRAVRLDLPASSGHPVMELRADPRWIGVYSGATLAAPNVDKHASIVFASVNGRWTTGLLLLDTFYWAWQPAVCVFQSRWNGRLY